MTETLLLGFCAILQALSESICFSLILIKSRLGKTRSFLIVFSFLTVSNCFSFLIPYNSIKPLILYFLRFALICILYKEPIKEKLFFFSILYVVSVVLEAVSFTFLLPDFVPLAFAGDINIGYKIVTGVILAVIQVPWILLFRNLKKEWEDQILRKFYIFVLGQFVLEIFALIAVYMNTLTKEKEWGLKIPADTIWQYRIGILLFVLVTVLIYFVLFSYMKREHLNIQLQIKKEELDKTIRYYHKAQQESAHLRRIRHDAENHLRMAELLIRENPEKAETYLNELKKDIGEL